MIGLPAATLISGALSSVGNFLNYGNQRSQLSWQKKQWDEIKAREDNAVSRKAADLERAGFNRVLAASGTGATTQQAPILSAPQMDTGQLSKSAMDYIRSVTMDQQLKKSRADIELTQSQIEKNKHEMTAADMSAYEVATRANAVNYDLDIAKRTGQPYKDTTIMSPSGIIKSSQSAVEQATRGLKWLNNPIPPIGKPRVIRVVK